MTIPAGSRLALRLAERVIRTACRALPGDEQADREQEWSAEAEAVAHDPGTRLQLLRAIKTLQFAGSLFLHARATRRAPANPARSTVRSKKDQPFLNFFLRAAVVATIFATAVSLSSGLGAAAGAVVGVGAAVGLGFGAAVGGTFVAAAAILLAYGALLPDRSNPEIDDGEVSDEALLAASLAGFLVAGAAFIVAVTVGGVAPVLVGSAVVIVVAGTITVRDITQNRARAW
ncbi:hypothetical protein [Streptomyces sp. H39-C1]|uniref:hypothetical protein n=1 Tax=Streptomyces sp. H39-C1 TaxID=3004355 RepID=UPI0022AF191D|nr:hypothetical protein [Streptomyces sp. H39-C1]MCZ4101066.1 hypothetical protein [Streptomyces sp. H39-C1]